MAKHDRFFGEAPGGRTDRDHHQGFNDALEDAVQRWAEGREPFSDPMEISVQLSVYVTKENPGRIEGYKVTIG
jgi:hypothetical protein